MDVIGDTGGSDIAATAASFSLALSLRAKYAAIRAAAASHPPFPAGAPPPPPTFDEVSGVHSFAGIAAVLFATQLSVIQSTVPPNLELTIITASVVGGVSILGGIGSVVGSTLAAILLAAIGSSLIFLSVSPYWIRAVQGVLILITVLADLWRRRRQGAR